MSTKKENAKSNLLNEDENELIQQMMGNKCQCLSIAVVQLFFTKAPYHTEWYKQCAGVLCLIKDNVHRIFYFRIYNMDTNMEVFEEQLFEYTEYSQVTQFLHAFQTNEHIVAFNFCNHYEAIQFNTAVQLKIAFLKKRAAKRCLDAQKIVAQEKLLTTQIDSATMLKSSYKNTLKKTKKYTLKKSKNLHRPPIDKNDISAPKDFVHTAHFGIDIENNFYKMEDCPPELQKLFKEANITEEELQDPTTRDFIADYLAVEQKTTNAKLEGSQEMQDTRAQENNEKNERTKLPPRGVNRTLTKNSTRPKVTPSRNGSKLSSPSFNLPPPKGPPPPLRTHFGGNPPPVGPPPPPPPPPLPTDDFVANNGGEIPNKPSGNNVSKSSGTSDSRGNLLNEIKLGKKLNKVTSTGNQKPPSPPSSTNTSDSRGNLLDAIRGGVKLTPANNRELPADKPDKSSNSNDLADALRRALDIRKGAIQDDQNSDHSYNSDEEWQ